MINIDLPHYASIAKASTASDLLSNDTLLLARSGRLSQYWAPFDYTPSTARLAIVGITPGREQATNALQAFGAALRSGQDVKGALRHAKLAGSFSGPMRANIVQMLDSIRLH